ncbi:MAG: Sensor histidine kinase LiaS [Luteibacter sp.]|uniref:sensor histidine kinase n=1 Tax=Luteibacter sp. TaxID=1886636 RepID=UPI0013802887|nr:sensor histidine kinase [Luteibacter sp.]KAF1007916.1 MAG: Sensor histidine kinase LiaS [Luteibacter sp.]
MRHLLRAMARSGIVGLALWGWLVSAWASDSRERTIDQFFHTAWTVREGAPGQVTALAQSTDGYLWLGTLSGLYRFDGVRFERYRPHGSDFLASAISTLYAPPSGGLWIGFRYGVISYVAPDGRATHYAAGSGLPTATVYGIAGTPDGRIWAATFSGLVQLDHGRWHTVSPVMGLHGARARNLAVDREGRLWVATERALEWLPNGGQHFIVATTDVGRINRIAEAPDGTIWVAEADGGVRPAWAGDRNPDDMGPVLRLSSAGLLFDRDGALWMPTLGDGIRRVPYVRDLPRQVIDASGTVAQRFVEHDGLSSDAADAVIQDREGNIWIGGTGGLDRFRVSRLEPAPTVPGASDFAIVAAKGHGIWAGTKNRPLARIEPSHLQASTFTSAITATSRDADGIWLAGPEGVWRITDADPVPFADLPSPQYTGVQAIESDGHGGVWLSINRPGLYHYTGGRWTFDTLPALANDPSPLVLHRDGADRLWMGFARNTLLVRDGAHDRLLGPANGVAIGNVTAMLEDHGAMLLGGELGLAAVVGQDVRDLHTDSEPLRGITGIVRDGRGDIWLNSAQGVGRIAGADMRRAVREPSYRPPVELFDWLDGLPGTPSQFRPLPSAVVADDGRLWFATTSGIVSIDPTDVPHNTLPPPVHIQSVSTDMGTWPTMVPVHLPPRTERLRIAYTATSLGMPERVRFRYRLEGLDTRWRDAGTEREAIYTDPPPGHYVFRVTAANEDGVWNEQGAELPIDIAPAFYEAWWFALLCVIAAVAALAVAYLARVQRIKASLRERLQERHAERERIARDLHDTLLQSIQGLSMRFQAIANRVPEGDVLRNAMEQALDRAEDVLVEARDRVRGLRAHAVDSRGLTIALRELASAYAEEHTVPIAVDARIDTSGMDHAVRDELYGIAREALHNAVAHADASRIDVVLGVEGRDLALHVCDDGRGMDETMLREGRDGHWGLRGIRERAVTMGAVPSITSRLAGGTVVTIRVPMERAFPGRGHWLRRRFRRREP